MNITATHIAYYHTCHRKLWLFGNGINMEHTSDLVSEGKLISETTYQQRARKYTELDLGVAKIDFYDAKNKVVHEVKKSSRMENAHEWQVKYYLLLLEESGVNGTTAILEYPKLRQTKEILLADPDRDYLHEVLEKIEELITQANCPALEQKSICKKCSYYDFCYSGEKD